MLETLISRERKFAGEAINLAELTVTPQLALPSSADTSWFTQARFGMFVHYGLYSLLQQGEWAMYFDKIPAEEYNPLADRFSADRFHAEELVNLARQAGAGYVVFTARHHDGFCLWDTETTNFNSVKTRARRDLVREYVDACRRAGLRVGIYYSIMSWQWPAIFTGPTQDPEGWEEMVNETHAQVRELMSEYGHVDMLWYDGCVVPGLGDAELRTGYWRTKELNAMVRELQPGILINDRAALPEDITTPEQHLAPAPPGRLWEFCQTMGERWAWMGDDDTLKDSQELIGTLIHCARFGGNYLLNVSLKPDGAVPEDQALRLREIGNWMTIHGASIRGSLRSPYTEAEHVLGMATARERNIYFHFFEWPQEPARIAGITSPIESIQLLGSDAPIDFKQGADGVVQLSGLPRNHAIFGAAVLNVKLSEPLPLKAPPTLLITHETGRYEPTEAPVIDTNSRSRNTRHLLSLSVPATGQYDLEIQILASTATTISVLIDGQPRWALKAECGEYPSTLRLKSCLLTRGDHTFDLRTSDVPWEITRWRLSPVWKIIKSHLWKTTGPFPTAFGPRGDDEQVRDALGTSYPPEKEGATSPWLGASKEEDTINFARLCGGVAMGICYAKTTIISAEPQELDCLLACDWWANLFVNGELVTSTRKSGDFERDGAWFSGWKPISARARMNKGKNTFLVKSHPGSTDNWVKVFINDPGNLQIFPG